MDSCATGRPHSDSCLRMHVHIRVMHLVATRNGVAILRTTLFLVPVLSPACKSRTQTRLVNRFLSDLSGGLGYLSGLGASDCHGDSRSVAILVYACINQRMVEELPTAMRITIAVLCLLPDVCRRACAPLPAAMHASVPKVFH